MTEQEVADTFRREPDIGDGFRLVGKISPYNVTRLMAEAKRLSKPEFNALAKSLVKA